MTRPILTFLHGFMGDPSDWDLVRRELSDYEIVTPLIQPAEDWNAGIEQLVDELPERSVLIGYSMGARLSLAIALARSKICDGLVFVSGNPGLEEEHAREVRYQSDTKIADRIEAQPRRDFLVSWYEQSTVFRSLTDQVREDEIERKAARTGDNWSEILRVYSVAKQPDFWPQLSKLQVPVMAMAGILDRKYVNIILRMGAEPNIESRVVPSCGHIVHREQPYVFLQLIREYLESNFPKE